MRSRQFLVASGFVIGSLLAGIVEAVPPQPPLTNSTLDEFVVARERVFNLRDNAFLYESAAEDISAQVRAWSGGDVRLNLVVDHVTTENVLCRISHAWGAVSFSSEHDSKNETGESSSYYLTPLAIGDVVPLEVARRLRVGNVLVVTGKIDQINSDGRSMLLQIGQTRAVALVAREFLNDPWRNFNAGDNPDLRTPYYPDEALVSNSSGTIVLIATNSDMAVLSTTGNEYLNETAKLAFAGNNAGPIYSGKHRFTFELLSQGRAK
ncbi:MAG: hypothetical protein MUF06_01685 [Pirellulaceae bacterium]|nr:hypothetical protein [Pirellulaceae bacterium]